MKKLILICAIIFNLINCEKTESAEFEQKFNSDNLIIEISSGKARASVFSIYGTNIEACENIKNKLVSTKRFVFTTPKSESKLKQEELDLIIKIINLENENIKVEIYDVLQKKMIKSFAVTGGTFEEKMIEIANKIYKTWVLEDGMFNSYLICSQDIGGNFFTLAKLDAFSEKSDSISPPISYLNDLVLVKNKIFIIKFSTQKRGFAIFSFNEKKRSFFKIISIQSGSVFSPAIYDNQLYISATNSNTTGIYAIPFNGTKEYSSFKEFENSYDVKTITKIYGKIASSIIIIGGKKIFCANYEGKNAIFILPNQKISNSKASYFDCTSLSDKKILAIKAEDKNTRSLVIIDLETGIEKKIFSKYYIGKPSPSPCGNWIAISCRNKEEKDYIVLIHKNGKYYKEIRLKHPTKHVLWVKKK